MKQQEIEEEVEKLKDVLKDCISTCKYLLSIARNQMTLQEKTYYEKSIEEFEKSIG